MQHEFGFDSVKLNDEIDGNADGAPTVPNTPPVDPATS
jgi:hypothetical protein